MRAVTFGAILLAAIITPVAASACMMIPPSPREGETMQQAYVREQRVWQQELWGKADVVFLGQVMSERLVSDDRVLVRLRILTTIKGDADTTEVLDLYSPGWTSCGPPDYPRVGERAIFYARRAPLPARLLRDRELTVSRHIDPRDVLDPQVPDALRAAARRLRQ